MVSSMKLKDIDEEHIQEIADSSAILARGLDYYESGSVISFRIEDSRIIAKVRGNNIYDIEISAEGDKLDASCNCPYDGYGCKHIVAVLYKWINEKDKTREQTESKRTSRNIDIKDELAKLDKQNLVEIVSVFAEKYADVKRDLLIRLTKEDSTVSFPAKEIVLGQIKELLHSRRDFISYQEMPSTIRRLYEIKEAILKYPPNIRVYLLEELSKKCIKAEEYSDDSDGDLGMLVEECLGELGKAIHEQNLSFEEKKPIMLKNLDNLEDDDYSFEHGYFDLLVEIPTNKEDFEFLINDIKTRMSNRKEDYEKGIYEDMLTELYKRANMDDKYLEMLIEDAEKNKNFFPLIEYWRNKGNVEKAIELAEEGIKGKEKPWTSSNDRLYEFLDSTYSSQNKKTDLLRIKLLHFKDYASLSKYKDIMDLCEQLGNWSNIKGGLIKNADGQVLIEIYLFENDLEKAYEKLMRSSREYVDTFKDKIAKALANKYPEKSLKIYFSLVDEFIATAQRDGYKIASLYAKKAKDILLNKLNNRSRWQKYIMKIREENKRRPALIEEFRKL